MIFSLKNSSSSQIENKDVEYWQSKVKEVRNLMFRLELDF